MFKSNEQPQQVTTGRFEIEQDGKVAYLEYSVAGKILGLIHTEVPQELRGKGMAGALAESAFQYAREHGIKVDVVCLAVAAFVEKHPEYGELLMK
jgi:uncharacterized protein